MASTIAVALKAYRSELPIQVRKMWSLKASRCFQASETWWKLPKEKGLPVTSAWSDFVGARISQMTGARKKTPKAAYRESHQSSVLNSPVRVTISTAANRPTASRSTAIAAAALKSA